MSAASNRKPTTYKDAGVDIDAGNAVVKSIKPIVAATARPGADTQLGGFGGLFDLKAAGFEDPVLVAATDGVGTKLKIAIDLDRHDTVGIDLVAMCANDILSQGAEPLFFLDYFATAKLSPRVAEAVVTSIAEGCSQAGCALIGGETAEMPGLYHGRDYDLAGFAVGAAERGRLLPAEGISEGDVVLGLASNGLHANGFSLVRKLVDDSLNDLKREAPFDPDQTLGAALLAPTRIYSKALVGAIRAQKIKALAHITGGGLTENLPRALPRGYLAEIDLAAWTLPPIFDWLDGLGTIGSEELLRTFNCGIGMTVVAAKEAQTLLTKSFRDAGETVFEIGHVIKAATPDTEPAVRYTGKLAAAT